MAVYLNRWQGAGVLNFPPELRTNQSGRPTCHTGIMCIERWVDRQSGESREKKTLVKLSAFGQQAEALASFEQGDNLLVEGRISAFQRPDKSWETVIDVQSAQLLGEKPKIESKQDQPKSSARHRNETADPEDIPF